VVKGGIRAKTKGKVVELLPKGAGRMVPRPVTDREHNWLAAVTTEGWRLAGFQSR
jgi:topoisomerase-4 subunit A